MVPGWRSSARGGWTRPAKRSRERSRGAVLGTAWRGSPAARELLRPGALPFPSLEAIGDEPLAAWLARRAAPAASAYDGTEAVGDLFPVLWPRLAGFLRTPRRLEEIAGAFQLVPEQVEAWLRR